MLISTSGSVLGLLRWQWKFVLLATVAATLVTSCHVLLGWEWMRLPSLPLAVVGASLGIFVSFRTNSSYDRWWEGRKLWGRMINTSRHVAIQAKNYFGDDEKMRETFIRRHIAYVHVFRTLLRGQAPLEDEDVLKYLDDDDKKDIVGNSNMTAFLLERQFSVICEANNAGNLNEFRLSDMDESLRHFLDIQGGCERIKKTPLPRAYGFIAERLIQWFSVLFPAGLVVDLGWATIPVAVLVAFCFKMISETGRVLEDPFNLFWNALPLHNISRTIEINLLEILGDDDLPAPIGPIGNGNVLM
ncbi:MAG: hypothetical protein GY822_31470 [Deltaproteobacteria bacterium]|nr:hypothetical protein [Deltaproteobacteria bacterium]